MFTTWIKSVMKYNYIMLPAFILDRGRKNFKIIGLPCPLEIWCRQGPYNFIKNMVLSQYLELEISQGLSGYLPLLQILVQIFQIYRNPFFIEIKWRKGSNNFLKRLPLFQIRVFTFHKIIRSLPALYFSGTGGPIILNFLGPILK